MSTGITTQELAALRAKRYPSKNKQAQRKKIAKATKKGAKRK